MKNIGIALCAGIVFLSSGLNAQQLSGADIIQKMDGKKYTFTPTAMAEWSGIWDLDLAAKQSHISAMPKGGNATYATVIKGDQLCNVSGVPGLHATHGLSGCFTVVQKKSSFYLYKGNRKLFNLRAKGAVN